MFDGTNTNLNFRIAMRAAELIEREGFCKNSLSNYDEAGKLIGRCWLGAIIDARRELGAFGREDNVWAIGQQIAREHGYARAVLYNNAPETTAADVASLLRETARRCLVEGK